MMIRFFVCVVLCAIIFSSSEGKPTFNSIPKLLVVSYDGFRYDDIRLYNVHGNYFFSKLLNIDEVINVNGLRQV